MNDPLASLSAQVISAAGARDALRDRAARTVQRYAPGRLARDLTETATSLTRETGDQLKRHPFTAAAAGVGVLAYIFHKPLAAFVAQFANDWRGSMNDADCELGNLEQGTSSSGYHVQDMNHVGPTEDDR